MKIQTKHSIHFVKSTHATNNSDTLGIAGRRLNELAYFKLPIMPSVIIDHYITQTIGEESLYSLLQSNLKSFATEVGNEYGENATPMLLRLRPSPNLHYLDCPTISYVGLTERNIRAIQKNIGKDDGRKILFAFLDSLLEIVAKIEEAEKDQDTKASLKLNISKMKSFLPEREGVDDLFDVLEMYSVAFPKDFFEDVKIQLDFALRLIIRLATLQKEEIGIVVEPIFYETDNSFCFGSCFTREINTGEKILEGEFFQNKVYLSNGKPKDIKKLPKEYLLQLEEIGRILENKKQEIYKMVFAIHNKKLYLLDASIAEKVSLKAKVIFLLELYNQKIIKAEQVIKKIDATSLHEFDWHLKQSFDEVVSNKKKNNKNDTTVCTKELEGSSRQIIDIATSFMKTFYVLSNAESLEDVEKAFCLGADGIGMFKTEKMLLSSDKINFLRGVLFSKNQEDAKDLYKQFIKIQGDEFYKIFKILEDAPITIRLLNTSLNDIIPMYDSEVEEFLKFMKQHNIIIDVAEFNRELCVLKDNNYASGVIGSRMGITYPRVYESQLKAIFEAIYRLKKENINTNIEIAIPLVNYAEEIKELTFGTNLKNTSYLGIASIAEEVRKTFKVEKVPYKVGAIIETPAGALNADEIARYTDFFIFDAVSLTEKTLGISRNTSTWLSYLNSYNASCSAIDIRQGFFIDESVQELINNAVIRASMIRSNAKFGLFIDHVYGRKNMAFFMEMQGNYISCCSDDIPIVLVEIAQAEIEKEEKRLEEKKLQKY